MALYPEMETDKGMISIEDGGATRSVVNVRAQTAEFGISSNLPIVELYTEQEQAHSITDKVAPMQDFIQ